MYVRGYVRTYVVRLKSGIRTIACISSTSNVQQCVCTTQYTSSCVKKKVNKRKDLKRISVLVLASIRIIIYFIMMYVIIIIQRGYNKILIWMPFYNWHFKPSTSCTCLLRTACTSIRSFYVHIVLYANQCTYSIYSSKITGKNVKFVFNYHK